jgi:hypothetical protein
MLGLPKLVTPVLTKSAPGVLNASVTSQTDHGDIVNDC